MPRRIFILRQGSEHNSLYQCFRHQPVVTGRTVPAEGGGQTAAYDSYSHVMFQACRLMEVLIGRDLQPGQVGEFEVTCVGVTPAPDVETPKTPGKWVWVPE